MTGWNANNPIAHTAILVWDEGVAFMTFDEGFCPAVLFTPGEVLALLSPLQELDPGLYLLDAVTEGWATVRWVIDEEATEQILMTDRWSTVPVPLLELFMPLGLRLSPPA